MNDFSTIESKYLELTPRRQHLFLGACIRHAAEAFSRVAGLPDPVRQTVVEPTLSALGAAVEVDISTLTKSIESCDRVVDELAEAEETDLQSLAFACVTALKILSGQEDSMSFVVDNLDEMIRLCDPDGEAGMDEEYVLRIRFLDALASSDATDELRHLADSTLDWERRWKADYSKSPGR